MINKLSKEKKIADYQKLNEQNEQIIKSQEEKLNKQEEVLQEIKFQCIEVKAAITATVQPDQTIKGEINIPGSNIHKLDLSRSRYV